MKKLNSSTSRFEITEKLGFFLWNIPMVLNRLHTAYVINMLEQVIGILC
ncbi:hypothetical protein [Pontibacillus chungwhensis]|uniref:Uncharacterized protein n=2 Tax=Pontibacillus TaxID=289201 RepID=A0ABY8V004_9BACI|nr:hypothetical protein [Pontibacillus chungwhensis]WIF99276.1 hypothetical protein QNI29_06345 [Pontibacillus chungwhensis]